MLSACIFSFDSPGIFDFVQPAIARVAAQSCPPELVYRMSAQGDDMTRGRTHRARDLETRIACLKAGNHMTPHSNRMRQHTEYTERMVISQKLPICSSPRHLPASKLLLYNLYIRRCEHHLKLACHQSCRGIYWDYPPLNRQERLFRRLVVGSLCLVGRLIGIANHRCIG